MKTEDILKVKVLERFGISCHTKNLHFIDLNPEKAQSLEPKNYPTLTLFWQALAFIKVSVHAYNL